MYSEALKILDRNTVKLMIDEMQESIDSMSETISEQSTTISEQSTTISEQKNNWRIRMPK